MGKNRKRRHRSPEVNDSSSEKDVIGSKKCDAKDSNDDNDQGPMKKKQRGKPLNGLVLSVSTLDVKGERHSDSGTSYRIVREDCIALGASVTAQVHKKVFAVICNQSAINNLTQRVRKGLKRKALLIDVEWIRQCKVQCSRVCYNKYLLNDMAVKVLDGKQSTKDERRIKKKIDETIDPLDSDEAIMRMNTGWSEPISLSCCCVCHETNRDDCKWCVACPVTLARKARKDNLCQEVTTTQA